MKNIATALVKAQKAFAPALKDSNNPFFKTKYADLSTCVKAVIDALNDNGIALVQKCHNCPDGVMVETTFIHESGEVLDCGILHVPSAKNDPQGYGSALTYARRYSLMAACGIAPEDDDGNLASKGRPAPVANPLNFAKTDASVLENKAKNIVESNVNTTLPENVEPVLRLELRIPNKESIFYDSMTDWVEAYNLMADKVAVSKQMGKDSKRMKLEELHGSNKHIIDKMNPVQIAGMNAFTAKRRASIDASQA
jgi:hypothetical protein